MRMSAQQGAVVAFELPYDASMIMFSTTLWKDLTCLMLVDLISIFSFLYQLVCQSQSNNLMFITEWTRRLQTAWSGHRAGRWFCLNLVKSVHTSILFTIKKGGYMTEKKHVTNNLLINVHFLLVFLMDKNNTHANAVADGQRSIKRKWYLKKKKEKGA